MGYLIEIDLLQSHIRFPQPAPDVAEEEVPACQQGDLNFEANKSDSLPREEIKIAENSSTRSMADT